VNIFVILIMALGVIAYVGYPFWSQNGTEFRARQRRAPATARPVDLGLEELELDREAGRLQAEDYAALQQAGITSSDTPEDTEDEIERRVRALREKRTKTQSTKRTPK
jgi:hypothetical protein